MHHNAWDAPDTKLAEYGHLPPSMIKEWATDQANLSELYMNGATHGVSISENGRKRKQAMMRKTLKALKTRSDLSDTEIETRIQQVEAHLEDPGLLQNFEYFDVPSSDFMLQFYFAVWDRRIAELMCYLHNYGKDLRGVVRPVPEDDIWYQMSKFEGMNINERKKAKAVVEYIKAHQLKRVTSFGGGNIPERLYGLMEHIDSLTVFDDGPVSPLEELFPRADEREAVNYIHEPLVSAMAHRELHGTEDLVWMHGVSMYLNEQDRQEMTGAILCGVSLLKSHGVMKYDYLVWTESMRRVIKTQNWPYNPKNPMVIFDNAEDAIHQGRETLHNVNQALQGKVFVELQDPEITLTEPWGVTSVRFTIKKYI